MSRKAFQLLAAALLALALSGTAAAHLDDGGQVASRNGIQHVSATGSVMIGLSASPNPTPPGGTVSFSASSNPWTDCWDNLGHEWWGNTSFSMAVNQSFTWTVSCMGSGVESSSLGIVVDSGGGGGGGGQAEPIGWLDSVDATGTALGWTCDADDYNAAVTLHFYVDGGAGIGTFAGTAIADRAREPAVGGMCGGNPNHGFAFPIPAAYRDGQSHTVHAYAINIGGGTNPELSGNPKTFSLSGPPACNDGADNDGDGKVDYPNDPGCSSPSDGDEYNAPPPLPQCENGVDDDQDGLIDWPNDPGCTEGPDNDEYNSPPPPPAQCQNGVDDDGDGKVDYPNDPGCSSPSDGDEYNAPPPLPQCENGVDDDQDGLIDWPNDPGCTEGPDNDEYNSPPHCSDGYDNDGDLLIDYPNDPGCTSPADLDESNAPGDDASKPVIAHGLLKPGDANEQPGDGSVSLYLANEGDARTEDNLVASGTVTGGGFTLRSTNSSLLAGAAAANDGLVNLDLVGRVGGWAYHEPIIRAFTNGAWQDENGAPAPSQVVTPVNTTPLGNSLGPASAAAEGTASAETTAGCIRYRFPLASTRGWTTVGELHNAADVSVSSFTYGYRADSYISKAYSLDGNVWRLRGMVKIGNESGSGESGRAFFSTGADNWARAMQTEFLYTKYRVELWCGNPFAVKVGQDYEIRPTKWVGSFRTGADLKQFDRQCGTTYKKYAATFGKGWGFSRETNRYATFSGAVSVTLAGATVSLDARSGMSRWVKVSWTFGKATDKHTLCGNDNFPPTASRIFAGT